MKHRAASVLLVLLVVAPLSSHVAAHGIYGHIHVTGWAIQNLPEGELRDFFASDPELLNAALFGAAFTDSGYFIQGSASTRTRAYSEHTHWEPFISDFIDLIIAEDPPPWDDHESRLRVAFMMGCAAHGLQDEIFDSLFLDQVRVHDAGGQEEADPATDGFLALDGYVHWQPTQYVPMETVLRLYESLPEGVGQEDVERGLRALTSSYLSPQFGIPLAESFGRNYLERVPWTAEHYLDPDVPGSLASEVYPTARYLEAIWDRLHGDFGSDGAVTFTFPEPPRRLRGVATGEPDSWITLIFGAGMSRGSGTVELVDEDLFDVPFVRSETRWGNSWGRLLRYRPSVDLEPGAWYEAHLADAELIDGTRTPEDYVFRVQVSCADEDDEACPDLGEIPVPDIEPPVADPAPELVESVESAEPAPDMGVDMASDLPENEEQGAEDGADALEEDTGEGVDLAADEDSDGAEEPPASSSSASDDAGCGVVGFRSNPATLLWLGVLGLLAGARRRGSRRGPR